MSGDVEIPTEYAMLPVYRLMRDQGREPPAEVRQTAARLHATLDDYMATHYPAVRSVTTSGGVLVWSRPEQPPARPLYAWGWVCAVVAVFDLTWWAVTGGPGGAFDVAATAFVGAVAASIWTKIGRQRRAYRRAKWARAIP